MEKNSIRRFLLSLLCSLMIASSQPSTSLFADIGSVPLESILDSVANSGWAGVAQLPSASDIPKVGSPQPIANGSEVKKQEEEPLKGLAMVVLTFGEEIRVNSNLRKLMGFNSDKEVLAAKWLSVTVGEEKKDINVIQESPDSPIHIIIVHRTNGEGTFYLTSPNGQLSKVAYAETGKGWKLIEATEAVTQRFEAEKRFWLDKERDLSRRSSRQR